METIKFKTKSQKEKTLSLIKGELTKLGFMDTTSKQLKEDYEIHRYTVPLGDAREEVVVILDFESCDPGNDAASSELTVHIKRGEIDSKYQVAFFWYKGIVSFRETVAKSLR